MVLRNQTFSGIRWTTFSSIGRTALQVAQVAILARLLMPAEFGLIAVVLAIMSFLQIFADAGVSSAIIHYQDITAKQLSSLYWLNVCISFLLALILTMASPSVAHLYREPELQSLLTLAALSMVMASLGQQLRISAQKNLFFSKLAKLELLAALCGFASAVGLAWYGAGVYSLVIGSLVNATIGSFLAWGMLAQGWRPLWRLSLKEIKPFLRFGGYMIGNNLANTLNVQIDILLGTRLLGVTQMGAYSVPRGLMWNIQAVINPIITQVGLPVMAKAQNNQDLLKLIYLKTMRMTASVNFPIYMGVMFFAPEIVLFMLGDKWHASIPLLRIFACWGLLRSISNPIGSLLYATGRADLSFRWNVGLLVVVGPVIWLGSQFGAQGMAIAMASLMGALYLPNWYFLVLPLCGARLWEYSRQLGAPLIVSFLAGVTAYVAASLSLNSLARLFLGGFAGVCSYLILSWYFNRDWIEAMLELLGKKNMLGAS